MVAKSNKKIVAKKLKQMEASKLKMSEKSYKKSRATKKAALIKEEIRYQQKIKTAKKEQARDHVEGQRIVKEMRKLDMVDDPAPTKIELAKRVGTVSVDDIVTDDLLGTGLPQLSTIRQVTSTPHRPAPRPRVSAYEHVFQENIEDNIEKTWADNNREGP